jgi:hypothetical protein
MINVVYAVLATIATIMMFLPKPQVDDMPLDQVQFNKVIAASSAFIVGIAAGIVGAAGAFILMPIMLVVLRIPTKMAIASSLAITFISSIGSTFGKIITDQIVWGPAVIMIIASLIAAPIGANVGKNMNTKALQWILALLILASTIKIWSDLIA